jgi:hypothetical protein
MTSAFLSQSGGLEALTRGTFNLNVATVIDRELVPGLPVAGSSTQGLESRLLTTSDLNFTPLTNPFVGTLQATAFSQSGQAVANVNQITLTNAGAGTSLVNAASAPIAIKSLTAGSGVTFTSTATDIKIDSTSAVITLASAGGAVDLVQDGTGPALATRGLTAGTGIALTQNANDVTIANTDPGSAVALTSAGGTETLVNDGVGPALATKGLTAGAGVGLTATASAITIANTDPGSAVALTSAGGAETLVNDGVGPALATKGLTAGVGISLTATASAITIANTDPGSAVSLASVGTVTNLVTDGTGPTLAIRGLTAGAGIVLTQTATDISVAALATAVTLSSAAGSIGTSLVGVGTGSALTIKGMANGTNTTAGVSGVGDVSVNLNTALTAMTSFTGTGAASMVMTAPFTVSMTNCNEFTVPFAPNASSVQSAASNLVAFSAAPSAQALPINMTPAFLGGFSTGAPGQLVYNAPYGQRKWLIMYTVSYRPTALTAGSLVFFVSINGNVSVASATLAKAKVDYQTITAVNLYTMQAKVVDTIRLFPGDTIALGCQLATGPAQGVTFSGITLSMIPLLST